MSLSADFSARVDRASVSERLRLVMAGRPERGAQDTTALLALFAFADGKGETFAGVPTLARTAGVTTRTMERSIARLIERGDVLRVGQRERWGTKNGRGFRTRVTLRRIDFRVIAEALADDLLELILRPLVDGTTPAHEAGAVGVDHPDAQGRGARVTTPAHEAGTESPHHPGAPDTPPRRTGPGERDGERDTSTSSSVARDDLLAPAGDGRRGGGGGGGDPIPAGGGAFAGDLDEAVRLLAHARVHRSRRELALEAGSITGVLHAVEEAQGVQGARDVGALVASMIRDGNCTPPRGWRPKREALEDRLLAEIGADAADRDDLAHFVARCPRDSGLRLVQAIADGRDVLALACGTTFTSSFRTIVAAARPADPDHALRHERLLRIVGAMLARQHPEHLTTAGDETDVEAAPDAADDARRPETPPTASKPTDGHQANTRDDEHAPVGAVR